MNSTALPSAKLQVPVNRNNEMIRSADKSTKEGKSYDNLIALAS